MDTTKFAKTMGLDTPIKWTIRMAGSGITDRHLVIKDQHGNELLCVLGIEVINENTGHFKVEFKGIDLEWIS